MHSIFQKQVGSSKQQGSQLNFKSIGSLPATRCLLLQPEVARG